ncbi:MAG: hypothetical protein LQ346_000096 [Caloplaca aetnensis]|nr:MAG: hypothetical protein LQ346_000096 [Caloplaca aetnensis]
MMQPGLARISQLLQHTAFPWRAVHVAGTNGKGSVCAYVSAMLHAAKLKTGRFTSPHLIDRWDCITIAEQVIDETRFREIEKVLLDRNLLGAVQASEFELLTATAFELFAQEKVDVGVVEVGLGGRYDATNVIVHPFVTVITKIGKDHQPLLGDAIKEIASHKAGILKPGVTCVVDATNSADVLSVIKAAADEIQAGPLVLVPTKDDRFDMALQEFFMEQNLEPHQQTNVSLAYHAAKVVLKQRAPTSDMGALIDGARKVSWPGRLQSLSIATLTGRGESVLLDGAHNAQSAEVLGFFVNKRIRSESHPVTWVIAVSWGKELRELLSFLCQPADSIVAVEFSPVDGMPWVSPIKSREILEAAQGMGVTGLLHDAGRDIPGALQVAAVAAAGRPIVICGSLYLVSDVLRLLSAKKNSAALL